MVVTVVCGYLFIPLSQLNTEPRFELCEHPSGERAPSTAQMAINLDHGLRLDDAKLQAMRAHSLEVMVQLSGEELSC